MSPYLSGSGSRDFWKISGDSAVRSAGTGSLGKGGHAVGSTCKLLAAVVLANQGSWFQLVFIQKGSGTIPLNIFSAEWNLHKSLKAALHSWGHLRATETWRGERKTEEGTASRSKSGGKEERMSIAEVLLSVQNDDSIEKICPRKFPKF